MQLLNSYVDELQRKGIVKTSNVEFWVLEDGRLTKIQAKLPSYGSLGPLFYAFSLISAEELQSGAGSYISSELLIKARILYNYRDGPQGRAAAPRPASSIWHALPKAHVLQVRTAQTS